MEREKEKEKGKDKQILKRGGKIISVREKRKKKKRKTKG